ncbi:MAG: AbrB/MazE/SpoVT family DNA-binding domain-containing protein [Candidatus Aenigmatarchaeota archaeon]
MPTVSEKGQVTIPKEYRDKMGLKPGNEVVFKEIDGELVVKKDRTSFRDYEGFLSLEDTERFIERVRGQDDSSD